MFRLLTGAKRFARRNYIQKDNISTPPVTVAIRPSYKCNLRCVQCGQWGKYGALKNIAKEFLEKELTTEQIKSFIAEIAWFRPYIFFTGGEPLLRKDIFELIKFAGSKNLLTSISTNCTLLEEKADMLVKSGVDYVFASFDGPPQIDEKIRLGENSSVRAMQGIKALVRAKKRFKTLLPLVQIQFTLTLENQYDILKTAEFVNEELEVDTFGIVPGVFTTEKLSKETSKIYEKEFKIKQKYWEGFIRNVGGIDYVAIEEQIKKIHANKWKFRFRPYPPIYYKDFSFREFFDNPEKIFSGAFCATPYVFTQLQPNGDIATCGSQPDYIAGNILKSSFMDIWNGEKYRRFREFTKKRLFPSCPRCWALYEFYKYV
jgi:MoaA/NifB/PqqE/SkfB family radical SAM enzyme